MALDMEDPLHDEEEQIQLSGNAIAALQDFYTERDAKTKQFEDLLAKAEDDFASKDLSMDAFAEDWNTSQFWYTDETANALAHATLLGANSSTRIAVVSAPSAFVALKKLTNAWEASQRPELRLLEYDQRFSVFKTEFVTYDFAQPFQLPYDLKGSFDRIIVDPPFLSSDCQTKTALTVRWLSRSQNSATEVTSDHGHQPSSPRIILCTGERMSELVLRLYRSAGLRVTTFNPAHSKGLSNEFRCYANFGCDSWSIV